ncbi:MAG: hypothetical protein LBQ91_01160, partial [Oscillospiraceae bacterium]|nr:hypothetical protein [Oscillospiraceae bacterium]
MAAAVEPQATLLELCRVFLAEAQADEAEFGPERTFRAERAAELLVLCDVLPLEGQAIAELIADSEFAERYYESYPENELPVFFLVDEHLGENSCPICGAVDNAIFPIWAYEPGITAPPFHPHCHGEVILLDKFGSPVYSKSKEITDDRTSQEKWLDTLQSAIDVMGLFPIIGDITDGVNAVISMLRGNEKDALLSLVAMVPFAGWGATAAKYSDEALAALKYADNAIDSAIGNAKYLDDVANGMKLLPAPQSITKYAADWLDDALSLAVKNHDAISGVIKTAVGKLEIINGKVAGKIPLDD